MMTFNSFSLKPLATLACAAGIIVMIPFHAIAADLAPKLITDWYQALRDNDHETMDSLLDDHALVELKDIGIIQSKAEFIEALDEWSELNADTSMRTRLSTASTNEIVMDVCYNFTSNEVQTREIFQVADSRITRSVQEQVAESCDGVWD